MSRTFVRDATGLVKEISGFSAFAYNVNSQTVAFAVASYAIILAFAPGADPTLSFLLGMVLTIPLMLVYVLFTASMPRSGGEYVFISRTLHPWLGAWASFVTWWIEILYLGINTSWIGGVYISAPLIMMGQVIGSSSLVAIGNACATPLWAFIIGSVVIIGIGLTLLLGTSAHFKFQNLMFVLGTIAALVMIAILAGATPEQFIASFNRYLSPYMGTADAYHSVVSLARQQGFTTAPFSWYATLVGLTAASNSLAFGYFSTYCSGEMKRASEVPRQMGVMIGSMVLNAGLSILIATLVVKVAGAEFAGAAFYLGSVAPQSWAYPVAPFLNVFIAMLTDNVVLNVIIGVGWMVWGIVTTGILFLMLSRVLFAWSFDRLIPSWFADVNERFHAPVKATVFIIVAGEIFTYIFLQVAPAFAAYLSYAMALAWWASAFLLVSIAAIAFPYKSKTLFEGSVAGRYKIGKVPLISIAGVMALIYVLVMVYFWLSVSSLGVNTPGQLLLWGGSMAIAALIYPVIYFVRKKQGIDLGLVFRSVPPE